MFLHMNCTCKSSPHCTAKPRPGGGGGGLHVLNIYVSAKSCDGSVCVYLCHLCAGRATPKGPLCFALRNGKHSSRMKKEKEGGGGWLNREVVAEEKEQIVLRDFTTAMLRMTRKKGPGMSFSSLPCHPSQSQSTMGF